MVVLNKSERNSSVVRSIKSGVLLPPPPEDVVAVVPLVVAAVFAAAAAVDEEPEEIELVTFWGVRMTPPLPPLGPAAAT